MEDKAKILHEKVRKVLEKIGLTDNSAFYNDLKTNIEALSAYQSELELQNLKLAETVTKLQKQNNTCLNLFNNAPLAYVIVNSSNAIKNINHAACSMLGCIRDVVIDTPFTRFIHAEFQDSYTPYIKSLAENNETHSCEIKLISLPDSKYFFVHINGTQQLPAEDEEPTYLLALTNITQQKETEEKLAEESQKAKDSEKLLNEMGKIAKIGGWELDCTTVQQVWTDETYTIHDREKGVYNPNSTEELSRFEPGSKEIIEKAFEAAFTKGEPYDLEVEMTTIKGNRKWVRAVCSPILKDDKVSKLTGTLQDISRRKQAEKRVLETKENYKNIFENNPLPMWVYDLETLSFMAINDAALVKYGYTREEFLKMTILDIRPKEDQTRLIRNIASVTEGLDEAGYWQHIKKNGDIIDVEITSHTLSYFGRKAELVVTNDITARKYAENQLAKMAERLNLATQSAGIGIWDWNIVKNELVWDEKMIALYGLQPGEFKGAYEAWLNGVHPEDRELSNEISQKAVLGEIEYNTEFRVLWPDGSVHWLKADGQVFRNDKGEAVRMIGVNYDITERKHTEELLKKTHNTLEEAQKIAHLGSFEYDVASKTTIWSEEEYLIYGLDINQPSPEYEVMLQKCIHPDDAETLHECFTKAMSGFTVYELEHRIVRPDGNVRWVYDRAQPYFDGNGNLVRYIGITLDITDRKLSEKQLAKMAERLNLATQSAGIGIWDWNIVKNELVWDEKMIALYGLQPGEFKGAYEAWLNGLHPDDREESNNITQNALQGKGEFNTEFRVLWPDGSVHWLKADGRVFRNDKGEAVRMIGVNYDITDRKKNEKLLRQWADAFENCAHGIAIGLPATNNIMTCNQAFAKLQGRSTDEIVSMPILSMYAPEDHEHVIKNIMQADQTGSVRYEAKMVRKNGEQYLVQMDVVSVRDDSGKILYRVATQQDIAERKIAENALRESEFRFFTLFRSNPIPVGITRASDFMIVDVNDAWMHLTGFTREEAIGHTSIELGLAKPQTLDQVRELLQNHNKIHQHEIPLYNKSGQERQVLITSEKIMMGGEVYFMNNLLDITEKKKREDEIRSQNEKLSAILNSLPDKLFVHDANGNFLEAYTTNPDGYIVPVDQFLGKNLHNIFPKDVADLNLKHLKECLNRKELITHEFSTDYKGVCATFEVRVVPFMDDKVIRFVRDITQSKEYERQIVKLNKAIEQSPVAIVITDINANITYVSRAFEFITGYSKNEIIGKNTRLLKSDKNNTQLYTDMWRTIQSGEIWEGELINKKKDGTLYWEALSITPLYENSSQITGYLAVKQDITDKKNREQEILDLNASLERKVAERTAELRDLYNNAPCGYHSLDSKGVFEMVNDTELVWLGYTREDLIGKQTFRDLLTEESKRTFENNFEGFKKRGYVNDLEFDMVCKNGNILSVLLNATAIKDKNGNFVRSRSTIIDHTQRKKAEEALKEALQNLEAANKELEAFSYSVSHDLRAPLRAIGGFTRILIEDYSNRFDDEGKRICDVIMSSSEKMGKLIDDLLAFSRFGRSEMNLSKLNMEPLIRSVIQELTTPKSLERINITIEPLPDVRVDATLMKQVWMNLISNAIKYSSQKEKATIEISPALGEGEVIFKIKDNGSGFEMQYVDKLFGVFQRLHKESEFEGTGVGLAIVKRIINRHGGRVWAESKLNEGAAFYFSLPKYE